MDDWPFDIPRALAVVTTSYVTDDRLPILEVTHAFDDEGDATWQFHCGNGDYRAEVLKLVAVGTLVDLDRSLVEILTLPSGHEATRASAEHAWVVSRLT